MNNFEHHIGQLEALGFKLELGMLLGESTAIAANQIGFRFSTATTQVDTYMHSAFFEANKSHPVLGEQEIIDGPNGKYTVTQILANA